ncbi:uncharacterized protein LOC129594829 [Paramacrobiotus metropolitanus]|uniref:uncharacterized protein LOC129594829 n=1 Tax=Paramacrobiotus metropolitanus TaxID=2943436 RepID=UPI002445CFE5|nr:uncharacterized protein LOC129594829 [Paramacrobiotus metropolitanus]XP_055347636.1 uncharacterized protein LOC129594829 [Paramacrobiotus metropolitanus]
MIQTLTTRPSRPSRAARLRMAMRRFPKRRNIRIPASASRSKASQPVVTAVPQLQIQIGGGQQEWQWGGLRPLDHAPAFQRSSMLAAGSSASPPSAVQRSYTEKRVQFSKFPYARAADRKLRKPGDQKCTRGPAVPACFGRIVRQSPTKVKSARPGSTITVRQRHPRSDLQAVIRGLRLALGIKNKCPYPLLPAPVLLELVSKLAKCSIADNSWDVAVPEFDDMAVDFEGSLDDVVTSEFAYEEADIWMAMDYARNTGGDASEKGNTLLDVGKKTFQWIGKLWNRETDRASTDVRDSEEPESVDHWARVTDAERANWTELDTSGTGLRCEEMRGGDSGMSFADVTMTSDTFGTPLNSPSSHAEAEQDEKGQLKGILSPSRVQSYGSPDKNRVRFNKTPYIRVIPNKADANRSWNFRDLAKPECSPFRLPRVSTDSDTSDSSSPFFQPRQLHFPSSDDSPVITPQKTPGADTRPSTLDLLSPRTEAAHVLLSMQGGSSGTPNNTATEEFARPARPATPGPLGLRFSAGLGKSPRLPTVLGGKKAGVENGLPMVSALVNELQSVEEKDEEKLENGKTNRPWRYRPAGYVRPQDRPKPVDHGPRPLNPEYFPRFCKPFVYVEPEKKDTVVYSYPLRDSGCSLETLLGYCKNSNNALIEAMRAQQQEEEEQLEQEEEFIEDDSMGESTGVESGLAEVPRDDRSLDEDDEIAGELVEPTDEEKSGNNATIAMEELEAAELLNQSAQPDLQQPADATDEAPEEAMEEELGNVEVIETDEVMLEERDDDEESEKMSVESVSTAGGDVPTEGYYVIEDEETTGSEGSTVGRKDEGVVSVTLVEEVTEIFAHQDDSESDSDSSDDNAVEYSDKSDSESSEEDDNDSVGY